MNITVMGYYGYRNFGDDILLLSLLNRLDGMKGLSRIWVLVRDDYYKENPLFQMPGVSYVPTMTWKDKLRKYRAFLGSRVLFWGGGTCLYEPESGDIRGMEGFLRNILLFRILGKRFGFVGIGMGPLRSGRARRITKAILDRVEFVTFRDPASIGIARSITDKRRWQNFRVCGDLFFLSDEWIASLCARKARGPMKKVAFCGYCGLAQDDGLHTLYAECLDRIIEDLGVTVSFVPMQVFANVDDNLLHEGIRNRMRNKRDVQVLTYRSIEALISAMNEVDFVIGMRLHSLVLADVLRIPSLGIAYNPKVPFYLKSFAELGVSRECPLGQAFLPEEIVAIQEAYWQQRDYVDRVLQEHRARAEQNIDALRQALFREEA
jgi:polysaccharide pyruvyl transferase WcaK-like protein